MLGSRRGNGGSSPGWRSSGVRVVRRVFGREPVSGARVGGEERVGPWFGEGGRPVPTEGALLGRVVLRGWANTTTASLPEWPWGIGDAVK